MLGTECHQKTDHLLACTNGGCGGLFTQVCFGGLLKYHKKKQRQWEEDLKFVRREEEPDWGQEEVQETKNMQLHHQVSYTAGGKVSV